MLPTSPKREDPGGSSKPRYHSSPTRFVEEDDLTPPPRQPRPVIGLRLRADSNGSTNNAFFHDDGHPPLPVSPAGAAAHSKKQHKSRRTKKKRQHSTRRPVTEINVELQQQGAPHHQGFWQRDEPPMIGGAEVNAAPVAEPPAAITNRLDAIHRLSTAEFSSEPNFEPEMVPSNKASSNKRISEISTGSMLGVLGTGFLGSSFLAGGNETSDFFRVSPTTAGGENNNNDGDADDEKEHRMSKTGQSRATKTSDKDKRKLLYTLSNDYSENLDDEPEGPPTAGKKQFKFDYDSNIWQKIKPYVNPSPWLIADVKFDERGTPYFDDRAAWTAAGFFRHYLYNPISPEFTSLQQFWWAVIIGIAMGVYTALWKMLIESGVDFVWETVPEILLELGVFTDLDGSFPLYHYMWICPMIFGGILSYIFCILPVPIPGQNEWIKNLHSRGVQDYRTFWPLFILATLGMLSGLSLGPELPLVLTAGMFGSWLGMLCQQSMLQARVLNLTAASAAVGGFFGFPMAGALFVLEIPHRMGLQYFEALSPATISSIIAVVTNRIIVGNDVTGYFKYPFLSNSLPSQIFTHAIIYGLYGAAIGVVYAFCVMKLKGYVHDWFHAPHDHHDEELHIDDDGSLDYHHHPEETPLVEKAPKLEKRMSTMTSSAAPDSKWAKFCSVCKRLKKMVIPHEPYRAAVAGAIASALCGVVAMFVPHTLFWGEAQLQNLIDKGRTPLPVFGQGDEPTADLTALGYCLIDPTDPEAVKAGFSIHCSILLMVSKTIVIGLSLGTGIIGGHFWGPLFIGCAAGHFLGDVMNIVQSFVGFGGSLAAYPCLVILCTMGSAHVVTFRAHTAIMLILTLTISSFTPEDNDFFYSIAGDYSAVFPLLVISVFVSLMVSRQSIVFYKEQRSRGDISAVPEVLCEPGMEGRPLVHTYEGTDHDFGDDSDGPDDDVPKNVTTKTNDETAGSNYRPVTADITQDDIEKAFSQENSHSRGFYGSVGNRDDDEDSGNKPQPVQSSKTSAFSRLDALLSAPIDPEAIKQPRPDPFADMDRSDPTHRRSQSAPAVDPRLRLSLRMERRDSATRFDSPTPDPNANRERSNSRGSQVRVESFGELHEHQPPLLEQARLRAASRELTEVKQAKQHRRSPSSPGPSSGGAAGLMAAAGGSDGSGSRRHSRQNSMSGSTGDAADLMGALSLDEIEQTFNAAVNASMNPK